MRILLMHVVALTVLSTFNLQAQEPRGARNGVAVGENVPTTPSPQLGSPRDYSDPYRLESGRAYLQRRAQEQTALREARIEGMRWLGYSPLRPTASGIPFTSRPPTWGPYPFGWYHNNFPYWHANFSGQVMPY